MHVTLKSRFAAAFYSAVCIVLFICRDKRLSYATLRMWAIIVTLTAVSKIHFHITATELHWTELVLNMLRIPNCQFGLV